MSPRPRNRAIVAALLFVVGAMLGLTAASVPLYRLFCQVTGYGGTTQRAASVPAREVEGRLITVRFDASTAPGLDWEFRPLQAAVRVHPGEEKVIAYRAVNHAKTPVTGTATFNVTPSKAGIYFDKLQCFCFTRQHLAPGESADLTVSFFVDPDIASDPATADVDTITLSYTMFRAKDGETPVRSSALPAQTPPAN
ncbi:MAG TPA: cytochrome c oxidase assembly protein [Stellaceae bacterium]|jgi:cytochrome c oxidase assembly protein subunit 11|nr:cytochrome c oxidase assembly protein [Stellaceae bacterium]